MKYFLCVLVMAVTITSCNDAKEQLGSRVTPASLLTNDKCYWSVSEVLSNNFNKPGDSVWHHEWQELGAVQFLKFSSDGKFERLEYCEKEFPEWITIRGYIKTSYSKAGALIHLYATEGVLRSFSRGTEIEREIPVEELYLQYSSVYAYKTGIIPGMAGRRLLQLEEVAGNKETAKNSNLRKLLFHEERF